MPALHQRLSAAWTPQKEIGLERRIAATDSQLGTLIYALYGLTDAEIRMVETPTSRCSQRTGLASQPGTANTAGVAAPGLATIQSSAHLRAAEPAPQKTGA